MTIRNAIIALSLISALAAAFAGPAAAQICTRQGVDVSCDDGRRGMLSGDAILWPDGTRSSSTPHQSLIIGNKSSVLVGPGVFVGQGQGHGAAGRSERAEQAAVRDFGGRVVLLLKGCSHSPEGRRAKSTAHLRSRTSASATPEAAVLRAAPPRPFRSGTSPARRQNPPTIAGWCGRAASSSSLPSVSCAR
ncbi:hypothetical protein ACVWW7_003399 [Bradyrhizobium sp. LM6.9]